MNLSPMRFKSFVWPHNPRTYTLRFERAMAVRKIPFGLYHLQSLGRTRRVLRGEGEFVGQGAYDSFKQLANLFYQETPGTLIHPVWMTTRAWLVGLEAVQQPRADYVRYTFEFWEVEDGVETGLEQSPAPGAGQGQQGDAQGQARPEEQLWHTVARGDTLWGLARSYGVKLEDVIALNPSIRNPNLIYPGEKVRIA